MGYSPRGCRESDTTEQLNNNNSIVYMLHIFCIHSFVEGHLGSFHALAIVNSVAMNIGVRESFQAMFFSNICLGVGLQGHMVVPGVSDGQGTLACCSPWGCRSQTWLND